MNLSSSERAFAEARTLIPGGVNSPVRAFAAVGGRPPFIKSGSGSRITDIDGNSYIDYVCSWGPLILGHCDADVVAAIKSAADLGSSFGAPTLGEIELARMITQAYPSIERVRLVNSGTEATMSAIRVARGFTGRRMIVKFEGCYHGHADGLLVKAGSGAATFGTPTSLGVPDDYAKLTVCLPFNDIDAVARTCESTGRDIACIIVEPVVGNMGVVPPKPGFLEGLREITARHGIVLIFDEVMTGFRVAYGGAQELFRIRPDLTTLGKVIGGGLPVGAYGGRAEIMDCVAPAGKVYQAGTLSGNPLAVAAGLATLRKLRQPGFYARLERTSSRLAQGLESAFRSAGVSVCINRVGSMICPFFTGGPVADYAAASRADTGLFGRFFGGMLVRGVYLPPSQFEAWFVSAVHSDADIDETIAAAAEAAKG
ncbi:MAG TPA: glutamate-1-semialdehyde 2,1-aminomutase [Planctomycetota bacterium]|nr:glutamate-1-semialdehyde 2,1-aminomutase [Planctomycetota bacterium]